MEASLSGLPWEVLLLIAFTHPAAFRGMALACREFADVMCDPEMQERAKRHFSRTVTETDDTGYSVYAELPNGAIHGQRIFRTYAHAGSTIIGQEIVSNYSNGQLHGDYLRVERNGRDEIVLTERGTYMNGLLDGEWTKHDGHALCDIVTWRREKQHGFQVHVNDEGNIQNTRYKFGVPEGFETAYYPNGARLSLSRNVAGKTEGVCKSWWPNGRLMCLQSFVF